MTYDFTFYLGTDRTNWVWNGGSTEPLFVAYHVLAPRKSRFPRGKVPFALDSGAYSQLTRNGRWTVGAREYGSRVRQIGEQTGTMDWAAIQDWMCSPDTLKATGKTLVDHQALTVESWVELNEREPDVQWLPILQGWVFEDYLRHLEMYREAGTDLLAEPLVGVGSIARRQSDDGVIEMLGTLQGLGLRIHGFGVKLSGLRRALPYLASSDSMAWSWEGRVREDDPSARHSQVYAEGYRQRVLAMIDDLERYVAYQGIFEHFPVQEDDMTQTPQTPPVKNAFEVTVSLEWDMAHRVHLHKGKCQQLHGHRYRAEITCTAPELDEKGMVVDFGLVKQLVGGWVDEHWDHNTCYYGGDAYMEALDRAQDAVEEDRPRAREWFVLGDPPTAENLAKKLHQVASEMLQEHNITVSQVDLWETPTSRARYSRPTRSHDLLGVARG